MSRCARFSGSRLEDRAWKRREDSSNRLCHRGVEEERSHGDPLRPAKGRGDWLARCWRESRTRGEQRESGPGYSLLLDWNWGYDCCQQGPRGPSRLMLGRGDREGCSNVGRCKRVGDESQKHVNLHRKRDTRLVVCDRCCNYWN